MTIDSKDVESISAWLDGELPRAESDRLASRSQTDTALSETEREMRQVDAAYKQTMRDAMEPTSLAAAASVRASFTKRRRSHARRRAVGAALPIAASLMIVAGGAIWLQSKSAQQEVERKMEVAMMVDSAVQSALETAISGSEVALGSRNSQFDIRITPTRTYRSTSNHWCRDFTEHVVLSGEVVARHATACRNKKGGWERIQTSSVKALANDI